MMFDFELNDQIKIDLDKDKKIFRLSAPIYRSGKEVPYSILKYVEARKDRAFRPHKTSFTIDENLDVRLIQEVPLHWGFQPTTRKLVVEFLQLAMKCKQMLSEMESEEALASVKE